MLLFRALPLLGKLAVAGALLAAIAGAYSAWHYTIYSRGYDAAIADIAAENKEAVDAADKVRSQVRDCFDGGGDWDVVGRVCIQP